MKPLSSFAVTKLFQAKSETRNSTFAVGLAIAGLWSRRDGGWTHASIARFALLARVDPKSVHRAIHELVAAGELEYIPGISRYNPSRYRIRTEVLETGVDRFSCPLTMDKLSTAGEEFEVVTMDKLSTLTMDKLSADHGQCDAHHGQIVRTTMDQLSAPSVNRVLTELELNSDQSAREDARTDDASKDAGVEQREDHPVALKTVLEDCRRSAHGSAGDGLPMPNPTPPSPLADAHSGDDYRQKEEAALGRATCPRCGVTGPANIAPGGDLHSLCARCMPLRPSRPRALARDDWTNR